MATVAAPIRADSRTLEERIEKMHGRDRVGAMAFVLALWVVMLFTLLTIWPVITNSGIAAVLVVSAVLVLLFNTAAIWAMLAHYREDKHFIYGLDLKHLDEMRRRRLT